VKPSSQAVKRWIAENPLRWKSIEVRSRLKRRELLRKRQAAWRKAHPKYYANQHKKRKSKDPKGYAVALRKCFLKSLYGTTHEKYLELLKAQRSRCGICRTKKTGRAKYFCIDHDHKTKKIRGLLCQQCNRGLGLLGDSLKAVRAAASYMETAYAKAS
jgi:hypothetical protein